MERASLEEAENQARKIGRVLKTALPIGWGFTIVLYTYDQGFTTYLSTGQREDCIKMLEELLTNNERWAEVVHRRIRKGIS